MQHTSATRGSKRPRTSGSTSVPTSGKLTAILPPRSSRKSKGRSHADPQCNKLYQGRRTADGCTVTVNGKPLPLGLEVWNHSPTGLEWGYAGSGPAQLALALLLDHLRDRRRAVESHQRFKFAVVARLPRDGWALTSTEIDEALQVIRTPDSIPSPTERAW